VGKAMHIASLIYMWRPFLAEVWTAIGSHNLASSNAPLNCLWSRQISHSLHWMQAFLWKQAGTLSRNFTCDAYFRVGRQVEIITDASPWGVGAVLFVDGVPVECCMDGIHPNDERCSTYRWARLKASTRLKASRPSRHSASSWPCACGKHVATAPCASCRAQRKRWRAYGSCQDEGALGLSVLVRTQFSAGPGGWDLWS
jgi:hypothetical protein